MGKCQKALVIVALWAMIASSIAVYNGYRWHNASTELAINKGRLSGLRVFIVEKTSYRIWVGPEGELPSSSEPFVIDETRDFSPLYMVENGGYRKISPITLWKMYEK